MRLLAIHNSQKVIIVGFAYEGEDNENLKAIYIDSAGEIDADNVANFTADEHETITLQG